MSSPLVLDIDGTMSGPDRAIEGRVFDVLRAWPAPVVIATGKAFPYPVALSDYIGLETRVIAENGGVVCAGGTVEFNGDPEAADRAADAIRAAGYDLAWDGADLINRWRETELAVRRDVPRDVVDRAAETAGLEVIDSGFAYHVKDPDVNKGDGVLSVAALEGIDPGSFVAVGDSENDVSTFDRVGRAYAVANADDSAKAAADVVTEGSYADGLLEALAAA